MPRTLTNETPSLIGQEVILNGWVNTRRDHGKIIFLDLRDRTGLVQVVCVGLKEATQLRNEWIVEITGLVKARPEKLVNPKIETGKIEIEAKQIKILSKVIDLPFDVTTDGMDVNEETRLKYRYLDIRRPRMAGNLRRRYQMIKIMRQYMDEQGFVEVETPILTKATPEGARDFLVPSRLQPGNFYALPQSPQQYKQLLMVAGIEKYFQIARCFRDEDPRADRAYGEFTQLDIEISFPTQEEILQLIENLYKKIVKEMFPEKHLTFDPFPRLNYHEVMQKHNTDKPDLRKNKNDPNELAFAFVVNFPAFEWKASENRWDVPHHPFTAPQDQDVPDLLAGKNMEKLKAWQYDMVLNGFEIAGGSIRITDPAVQQKVFEIMGHAPEEIKRKFGHLLEAFTYGVPPHGGIASGIDRAFMVLLNQPNLREVIAFPMNSSGQLAVMDGPSDVDPEQLKEVGVSITGSTILEPLNNRLMALLDDNKIKYQKFDHPPVHTSEEAAKARGTDIKQGAKALIMYADKKPIMIVISAATKLANNVFKNDYQVKDLRMATPDEVKKVSGAEIGAVPPFGNLMDIKTYVDNKLSENTKIAFNAGLHTKSLTIAYKDWEKLVSPVVGEFTE